MYVCISSDITTKCMYNNADHRSECIYGNDPYMHVTVKHNYTIFFRNKTFDFDFDMHCAV